MPAWARPETLDEALGLLARGGWTLVAGGTDVYPARGDAVLRTDMLDISRLPLRGIERTGDGWRIGALTTWMDVRRAGLPPGLIALAEAAREVGAIQIQHAGTVGGNIVNASPAADGTVALMALGAEVELTGPEGSRRLPVGDFVTGVRRTALAPGEMVVAVHLPDPGAGARSGFTKLGARKYLVISIAMAAAQVELSDGRVRAARVVVGACSPVASRIPALEARLIGLHISDISGAVDPADTAVLSPISDIRADALYRAEAVPYLLRGLLAQLAGDQP